MFYEYAAKDASRIGMAGGPTPEAPRTVMNFAFAASTIEADGLLFA